MTRQLKTTLLAAIMLLSSLNMLAQSPLAYLESTYPKLTDLYREELMKYPAHYVFAVDVSGTMKQYSNDVTNALKPFIQALPDNDRVDVIPFGTEAMPNMLSYCGVINSEVRTALNQNIGTLYTDPSYSREFRGYTDIPKAVSAIARVLQNNREYKVNVIILLTDFRNDVRGDSPSERKLRPDELERLYTEIGAATHGVYTRSVALELPVNPAAPGYCLPQLKEQVFSNEGSGLEIVPLSNPGVMIGQWFDQLKRDIMVTKLKAIIEDENRMDPIKLTTETDIDGNVKAVVDWTPNKLYPTMQIDSTYMDGDDFEFMNNKAAFTATDQPHLVLDLGKIKNQKYGLHHMNDSINLGVTLPTPYDDELASLGIRKPLPNTKKAEDRMLWSFFMPFWLTALLLLLLLLYLIMVLNAIKCNASEIFKGTVDFYDKVGRPIGDTISVTCKKRSFLIGEGGTEGCQLDGAKWTLGVEKHTPSPLLFFKKPYFTWKAMNGSYAKSTRKSRILSRYSSVKNSRRSDDITCGPSFDAITHQVSIRIK